MKFVIPIEPRTKKNSGRICRNKNKTWLLPSENYEQYKKDCAYFMPRIETINQQMNIKAVYYMKTKRRVDITNLHSALHDILVDYRVIEDDCAKYVVSTDGSRVKVDKKNPRTEVEITIVQENTGF